MVVHADTDFAGCAATRRSTSGGVIRLGQHTIKTWSTTQTTVSLSSGEAELHGLSKAGSVALGVRSVAYDLDIHLNIDIYSDSSAAIGVVRRRGLGRIRHLDVEDLWLQEKIRSGGFHIHKIEGANNMADIMTKITDRATLVKHLTNMNIYPEDGRAETAPRLVQQT